MEILTKHQRSKISSSAIAKKHSCSREYVNKILAGKRKANTDLAREVVATAKSLLEILEA